MLQGELVGLRARRAADVPVLHAGLYDDVLIRSRTHERPWRPVDAEDSPFVADPKREDGAAFSVVTLADDELVGSAVLWGIDSHNRHAHLGISLLPECRGRGLGADTVEVLCRYGFVVLGLRRLQLETLADNAAMIAVARRSGFVQEGTLREAAWVNGEFIDEVIFGLLAEDWRPAVPGSETGLG